MLIEIFLKIFFKIYEENNLTSSSQVLKNVPNLKLKLKAVNIQN